MNLTNIFESTDFVHASGTKEELQVAEFLKGQCEELGVTAKIEAFRVAMGNIEESHLFADGKEIPCKAFNCCGSGVVEGELYYMRERIRSLWLVLKIRSCFWILRELDFSDIRI